jgi:uncharacterized membrane protein YsdA (DUF1294 family)
MRLWGLVDNMNTGIGWPKNEAMKFLALFYLGMSVVSFMAYALDKSAARQGAWRISELTLHGLALGGGWPGALLAQQVLRHKTSKSSFRAVFWCTVALNLLASLVISNTLLF